MRSHLIQSGSVFRFSKMLMAVRRMKWEERRQRTFRMMAAMHQERGDGDWQRGREQEMDTRPQGGRVDRNQRQ